MIRRFFLVIAALALSACARDHDAALHGTQLLPPKPAAAFTLTDQDGRPFTLAQMRGQAVALYFGFTHCADVCPQTLALLGKARERAGLTPRQLRIVMISVDPRRDSPRALRAFFRKIGVQATGLVGSPSEMRRVYHDYGIAVEPQKNDIAHTDTVFLIDAQGRIRELLDPQTALKDVAADLRAIVD
jgi:protein SCO1/2